MSKKHFEALAKVLKGTKGYNNSPAALEQWQTDVEAIALVCQSFNSEFDTSRFFAACGVED